ncbi:Glycoside hydrolase family 5 protein [Mycena venus]|uniref:Glycoside hydrolase family 5 protein n=1 Tax=Mycena venus TaxID=2733690 RepID=A0A8H6WXQ4_9AGAR|nr:Glycoside hydrolase family 5 protein [Mycena venus]
MAHIAYPSTPNFKNFKTDYVRTLDWVPPQDGAASSEAPRKRPPTRATFFGTVKLHGTNATVVFKNGNKRHAQIQSRSWIIEDTKKDNCGTYALLSKAPLSSLIDQILAVAGKGVQKGVAITALDRFFAIFNIRIDGRWVDMRQYKGCSLPEHRIYNLAQYKNIRSRNRLSGTNDSGSRFNVSIHRGGVCEECPFGAAFVDGAGNRVTGGGEGIVWTMVRSPYMDEGDDREFDDTFLVNFKTKGENFATTSQVPKAPKNPDIANAAAQFADYALAERRYEQGIEYLEGEQARQGWEKNGYDVKLTGAFIKWVTEDAIKEERNEMERLGVPEKDAKREVGARAKLWYARKCRDVADALMAR